MLSGYYQAKIAMQSMLLLLATLHKLLRGKSPYAKSIICVSIQFKNAVL